MDHHFNTLLAEKYGIPAAVILNHLTYWVNHNMRNETNKKDGLYWTYNTYKAFAGIFSYMSLRTIKRTLKKLKDEELILTANYNKVGFDKTLWYTLNPEACVSLENGSIVLSDSIPQKVTCQNGTIESDKMAPSRVTKWHNGECQNGTMESAKVDSSDEATLALPIPGKRTDKKTSDKILHYKQYMDIWNGHVQGWEEHVSSAVGKKMLRLIPITSNQLKSFIHKIDEYERKGLDPDTYREALEFSWSYSFLYGDGGFRMGFTFLMEPDKRVKLYNGDYVGKHQRKVNGSNFKKLVNDDIYPD